MALGLVYPAGAGERDYQIEAVESVFDTWECGEDNSALLVMPTGTGKTVTAGLVIQAAQRQFPGKQALFIAHREELIEQAYNTFSGLFGYRTAIEQAGMREADYYPQHGAHPEVVVATVQTLQGLRLRAKKRDRFGVIIVDEAHHAPAPSYRAVLDWFEGHKLLGITGTADRADERSLGEVFATVAYHLKLRKAIRDGWLVPIITRRVKVPVDLRNLKTTGGDFDLGMLGERLSPRIEQIAAQIHYHYGGRQTVAFCPDIGCSQMLADMLCKMGIKAKYVAGEAGRFGMPKTERKQLLGEFKRREFQVICCCDLLVEGWDVPAVSCVVVARPTLARYKYAQMVGRGLRLCDAIDKKDCLLLDLDWQTDDSSKRLCIPVSLFTASCEENLPGDVNNAYDAHVRDRCDRGVDVDLLAALDDAEMAVNYRRPIPVMYTGKFIEKYAATQLDPVGIGSILDIKIRKSRECNHDRGGGPSSPWQIKFLESCGVVRPADLGMWGASKLIDKLKRRQAKGLASPQQLKRLLTLGVDRADAMKLTIREAANIIADHQMRRRGAG
jgi:superfamily II DNA or RNA helicase